MSGVDRLLWIAVVVLVALGIVSLPSIGWLLIVIGLGLALVGAARRGGVLLARIGAGVLGIVVAYLLLAPGFCTEGAAAGAVRSAATCTSLTGIPVGGLNWVPFLIVAPLVAISLAVAVRRRPSAG